MLGVEDILKGLYKADSTDKNLALDFYREDQDEPFFRVWEPDKIYSESMEIEESLSSSENLGFGSCEASRMKVTLINVEEKLEGMEMVAYQTLEGQYPSDGLYPDAALCPSGYTVPLGRYMVQTAERQANRKYRDVTALDLMCRFDIDVAAWYNALPFPMPLRDFRASLCRYVGVTEHVPDYLPNDGMLIEKTVDTAQLMGRDVLVACEQANGVFGHFDRMGVLRHITLQPNYTLMPEDGLYPSEGLYPVLPGEMNGQVYDELITQDLWRGGNSCRVEEHMARSIDRVQIRQEEGDIGATYGSGENCLTVEGNFLLFGKSASDLDSAARGIYGMVNSRQYIPYSLEVKGLPYLEVGDAEVIETEAGGLATYIIKRTLKGICALKDTHSATGEETRGTESGINIDIIQLKGKTAIIKRNVDEVSANLTDLEKNTEAMFRVTAEQISAEVKRAQDAEASLTVRADSIETTVTDFKADTESQFRQTAEQISLKVSTGDVTKELNSELKITGNVIELTTGHFTVASQNLAVDLAGNVAMAGKVTAKSGKIGGFEIDGNSLVSTSADTQITFGNVTVDGNGLLAFNWWLTDSEISCMAGIIANDDGDLIVHGSSYYDGKTVAYALDDLRRRVGGGGCSDSCSDSCSSECACDGDCDQCLSGG